MSSNTKEESKMKSSIVSRFTVEEVKEHHRLRNALDESWEDPPAEETAYSHLVDWLDNHEITKPSVINSEVHASTYENSEYWLLYMAYINNKH